MTQETGASPGAAKSDWIDISWPLHQGMTIYEMDEEPPAEVADFIVPTFEIPMPPDKRSPEPSLAPVIRMLPHVGTHVDAPRHVVPDGTTIDNMPLNTIIGPARVIEIKNPVSAEPEELEPWDIRPGERILLKTRNSPALTRKDGFDRDYVYLSPEGARFLKEKGVSVVGVDYIAVGNGNDFESNIQTHHELLDYDIWIIEALDLTDVEPGSYEIICLPLRITDFDGAPSRAIVRPL